MEWIKRKIKCWLGIDLLEEQISEQRKKINLLNSLVEVGIDVHFRGDSWAVICVAGKVEYVKFVMVKNGRDARDIQTFLRQFQQENITMDLPCGVPREMFLKP